MVLALGAAALPFAGRAQGRLRRICILSAIDPEPHLALLADGLQRLGYVEGRTLVLDSRSARGKPGALNAHAVELARSRVDVIVTHQASAAAAAKKATSVIPIVMAPAADPLAAGLIAALSRPGGNITGVAVNTTEVAARTLELIRDIVQPRRAARVAMLADANDPFTKTFLGHWQNAAAKVRTVVGITVAHSEAQFDAAFAEWDRLRVHAVIVQPGLPVQLVTDLGRKYRIPIVSTARAFVEAGGLMSYSNSPAEIATKAAGFVGRILKGAKPADLAVEQATTFDLALNLKAAKALDLEFPDSVIARADALLQ
ncbi:MAG TPA: ABC transporter substrate-binding protein [Burkholderiales bacterium]|nr:ABC transporter substrate-binding protein [Burkholderiales bacterium]